MLAQEQYLVRYSTQNSLSVVNHWYMNSCSTKQDLIISIWYHIHVSYVYKIIMMWDETLLSPRCTCSGMSIFFTCQMQLQLMTDIFCRNIGQPNEILSLLWYHLNCHTTLTFIFTSHKYQAHSLTTHKIGNDIQHIV